MAINRNRNTYMNSLQGRGAAAKLYQKYPSLKKNKKLKGFLSRRYGHPEEAVDLVGQLYSPDMGDYDKYSDDIWTFIEEYGPSTLHNGTEQIGQQWLRKGMSPESHQQLSALLQQMLDEGTESDAWDTMTDMRYDAYSDLMSPDGKYTDEFWRGLNDLEDLFQDVGLYGDYLKDNKVREAAEAARNKRISEEAAAVAASESGAVDSNGDPKGKDGLAGTKDDRGTSSADDEYDDEEYDDVDDSNDDDDDTQKTIVSALLGHSL